MNLKLTNHKSGQATLIFVMVTMVAILGIATASSSQSNINLKNTIYSVQGEQALSCAEAGVERYLGEYTDDEDGVNGGGSSQNTGNVTIPGSNCIYNSTIQNYPLTNGIIEIKRLNENATQELRISQTRNNVVLNVTPLNTTPTNAADFAIYIYRSNGSFTRQMFHCGGGTTPTDFTALPLTSGRCTYNFPNNTIVANSFLRVRAITNDMALQFTGFTGNSRVGYFIQSTGRSGSVSRVVRATRFYRQLPGFFDDAVVSFK